MKNILPLISLLAFGDNDLILSDLGTQLPASPFTDEVFDEMKTSTYLPRLQLMTSASAKVKDGDFPTNHYALVLDQDYTDLGKQVDVLILAWRPKAMDLGATIVTSFDPKDPGFLDIQKRSSQPNSNCMWGYEYLTWVPAAKAFATYFLGSKTARREAKKMKARLGAAATLGSTKIDNGKNVWFGPTTSDCSTPFDMPNRDETFKQIEEFNNPKAQGPELATDDDEGDARGQ